MVKYFSYKHVNCFFLANAKGEVLAFDAGWPCSLFEYKRHLKGTGHDFGRIKWCIVSHLHMDHAGLLGEFMESGITCLMTEEQVDNIVGMEKIILGNKEYRDYRHITLNPRLVMPVEGINAELRKNGFGCRCLETKGHSSDSLSIVTDEGEALIGDLSPIDQVMPDDGETSESWAKLIDSGAKSVYPSHAEYFTL